MIGGSLFAAALLIGISAPHGIAQGTVSLNVAIYDTNCFALDGEPAYELEPAVREKGTDARSLPGVSESTIDATLEKLQSNMHAIVVTRSGKLSGLLACGEINSVTLPDGTVSVGLREQIGSTYGGIAILSSNASQTTVRAFVSGGLSEGAAAEAQFDNLPIDQTVDVIVNDEGIEADQSVFPVGSRVQFSVTNEGTEPHEVMLELADADEEPLGDEGSQAEIEDMDEEGSATFTYTFDEPGDYQLADHIGSHYLVLDITVE